MTDSTRVLILGGGLAGLSFAIALAADAPDLDVTVIENTRFAQAPRIRWIHARRH